MYAEQGRKPHHRTHHSEKDWIKLTRARCPVLYPAHHIG